MYLSAKKPVEGKIYYIIKGFRDKNGKATSKNHLRLGTLAEIREREGVADPWAWILTKLEEENLKEREGKRMVSVTFDPNKLLEKDRRQSFNIGYLVPQKIYHEMGLGLICDGMSRRSRCQFDLGEIVRQLVLGRILWPCSKLQTWMKSPGMALMGAVPLHQYYRTLVVVSNNLEYIQQRLWHYTKDVLKRDTSVIYYDCTNFFFESTKETELRKPGASKENRRTPIVQMGIFMDSDGLPLAFCINPGNTNEQQTLAPLEKMIGQKMGIEEFIMCTDAGLSSYENRLENDTDLRKFITVQSVKTLPEAKGKGKKRSAGLKSWALDPKGWKLPGEESVEYDISELEPDPNQKEGKADERIFYKERWYKTEKDGEVLEQRLIVSFSPKYRKYQRARRAENLDKAEKAIAHGNAGPSPKDFKKYIATVQCDDNGVVMEGNTVIGIDYDKIAEEEKHDGFYAVCTNLEKRKDKNGNWRHTIADILKINRARWEIEESFRIMKLQMKARPVYLRTDKAVKAHFALCFLSLFIFRVLEHRMPGFTTDNIMKALRTMNAYYAEGEGYVPSFTRTDTTDRMFEISGFRLDTQIVTLKKLKSINALTKSRN